MLIRRASIEDVAALAKLGATTFVETFGHLYKPEDLAAFLSEARSEAAYTKLLQDVGLCIQLVFLDAAQGPIGYSVAGRCKLPVVDLEAAAGEVRELYVLADFQKHKLGSQLLAAALEWLQAQEYSPIYVGVWSENLGAQRLYGRFGFKKTGEYDFPVGEHLDREYILKC